MRCGSLAFLWCSVGCGGACLTDSKEVEVYQVVAVAMPCLDTI